MADDRTASLMTPAKLAQVKPKSPVAPAAWLDQMAADAGHAHTARLGELRVELQAHAADRDLIPLIDALGHLGAALPKLDFGLLQAQGWWARTTGKSRSAGAQFAREVERTDDSVLELVKQAQALQAARTPRTGKERLVLELEVEFRAIDKIIDQGTRWLEDMRRQIKTRQEAALDAQGQEQLRDDAMRCEILLARLKDLRRVSSSAHQAHERSQAAAASANATLGLVRQMIDADVKTWQTRVSRLAQAAVETTAPAAQLEAGMEAHRDLQLCVKQVLSDCAQVQAAEKAAADGLADLGVQLESLQT